MQLAKSAMEAIKEQVIDNVPKRIKELKFGIPYSGQLPAAMIEPPG